MSEQKTTGSRRTFLQTSSAALGAASLSTLASRAHAASSDTIKIALIGCGGRGTGAAVQALSTSGPIQIVALADAFEDKVENTHKLLTRKFADEPEKVDVPQERKFSGFDAYKKAIESDIDGLVIATPPGFRPIHFEYAVKAGRNVFMEKPLATDAPGVRKILAANEIAKEKGLKVGVGLQRHHQAHHLEAIQRFRDGEIGRPVYYRCYWNGGNLWVRGRQPGQTEMEYQMRNWYYFNWLCGDHIVEQHIHNIDVCNWFHDGHPVMAQGLGGRQVRTGLDHGEIYDHHAVEYTYADGTKMLSQCRQTSNCYNSVSEHVHGTEGYMNISGASIKNNDNKTTWRYRERYKDPYQVEHDVIWQAVRDNGDHNEVEYAAHSTMTAILGRLATYSGKLLRYDQAFKSEKSLMPEKFSFDAAPPVTPDENGRYPIAMPGDFDAI